MLQDRVGVEGTGRAAWGARGWASRRVQPEARDLASVSKEPIQNQTSRPSQTATAEPM